MTTRPKSIIRILSDLHAGPDNPAKEAAEVIASWSHDETTHSVVLAGDTFEGWAYPHDQPPPSMREVVAACPDLCVALRNAATRIRVFLVVGNHDMELTQDVLDTALFQRPTPPPFDVAAFVSFSEGGFPRRRPRVVSCFLDGRLVIEHGHADSLFNAPDVTADPVHRRPLGYWLCRMLAGKVPTVTGRLLREVVEEAGQTLLGKDTLAESAVDAAAKLAGMLPGDDLPTHVAGELQWPGNGAIRARYRDLWSRWYTKVGLFQAVDALRADFGMEDSLRWAMQRRAEKRYAVVITGHTHAASLYTTPGGSVLVNAGAFGPDGLRNRVEVEKLGGGRHAVTLYDGARIIGAGETP